DQGAQHVDDEPYVHGIAASLGSPRCALRAVPSTSSEERLDPWFDLRLEEEEDLVPWLDDGGAPGDEDLVLPDDEADHHPGRQPQAGHRPPGGASARLH